jgi:hypothetical protein
MQSPNCDSQRRADLMGSSLQADSDTSRPGESLERKRASFQPDPRPPPICADYFKETSSTRKVVDSE